MKRPSAVTTLGLLTAVSILIIACCWPFTPGLEFTGGQFQKYELVFDAPYAPRNLKEAISLLRKRIDDEGYPPTKIVPDGRSSILLTVSHRHRSEKVRNVERRLELPGKLQFLILANHRDHPVNDDEPETFAGFSWKFLGIPEATDAEGIKTLEIDPSYITHTRSDRYRFNRYVGEMKDLLLVNEWNPITERHLVTVKERHRRDGTSALEFTLNEEGKIRLRELTENDLPDPDGFTRHLAVVLNDEVRQIWPVNEATHTRTVIDGGFSAEEAEEIIDSLENPLTFHLGSMEGEYWSREFSGTSVRKFFTVILLATSLALLALAIPCGFSGYLAVGSALLSLLYLVSVLEFMGALYSFSVIAPLLLSFVLMVMNNLCVACRLDLAAQPAHEVLTPELNRWWELICSGHLISSILFLTGLFFYGTGESMVESFRVSFTPYDLRTGGLTLALGSLSGFCSSFLIVPALHGRFSRT